MMGAPASSPQSAPPAQGKDDTEGTAAQPAATVAPRLASPLARVLLMVVAVVSLGLAVLGAVTPGLPSTEFVLLAAWASARNSPRLHAWMLRHRLLGPLLQDWNNGRRIRRQAKWGASISMALCALLMVFTIPHLWLVAPAIAACMLGVQLWIWKRPEPVSPAGQA